MSRRIDYATKAPKAIRALAELQGYVDASGLEPLLLELVKLRASELNGCAYCLDMHSKDARALGESEQRIYMLTAWREAPCYSPRERAALAWTEAVTTLSSARDVPDAIYDEARAHFSEQELVDLNFAVIAINAWNRLGVPFRPEVGHYQPKAKKG